MGLMVYLAAPIDFASEELTLKREAASAALTEAGHAVYDPSRAFRHAINSPQGMFGVNGAALRQADAMLALLPAGVQTVGTSMEILEAHQSAKPVAVVGAQRSVQLRGMGIPTFPDTHDGVVAAVKSLATEYGAATDGEPDDGPARPTPWNYEIQMEVASPIDPKALADSVSRRVGEKIQKADLDPPSPKWGIHDGVPRGAPRAEPAVAEGGEGPTLKWVGDREYEPTRVYQGDAGFDLYTSERVVIPPGQYADVPCGVRIELPEGFWAEVTGRSSTLRNRGLLVGRAVIDQGYRGPMFAGVQNLGNIEAVIEVGERVAQLVPHRLWAAELQAVRVSELTESDRGSRGFGSSGS